MLVEREPPVIDRSESMLSPPSEVLPLKLAMDAWRDICRDTDEMAFVAAFDMDTILDPLVPLLEGSRDATVLSSALGSGAISISSSLPSDR